MINNQSNSNSYVRKDCDFEEEELIESFDEFNLKENILRGIFAYGFEKPSRIQSYAIPHMIQRKDLIAQSQSGTGKTGAFTIGVLNIVDEEKKYPQAIIMCNTHELAIQIHSVIKSLSTYQKINIALLIGGKNISQNMEETRKSQVLVCTPGRLRDFMDRGIFDSKKIEIFVIDEADVLLQEGFVEQTQVIVNYLPKTTQICLFSATFTEKELDITKYFMNEPVKILVKTEKLTLDLISQYYVNTRSEEYKFDILEDLYKKLSISQCIIYVNHIKKAINLQERLRSENHTVYAIHSQLSHAERLETMAEFRRGKFRVLISTDLICRGIDVQHINFVINYDLPHDPESYLHRIGRSGRYGKKGVAINFVNQNERDLSKLRNISSHFGQEIQVLPDIDFVNTLV